MLNRSTAHHELVKDPDRGPESANVDPNSKIGGSLLVFTALCFVAWFECHIVKLIEAPQDYAVNVAFTEAIVHRTPLFRVFQSRLLGPYMIEYGSMLMRCSYAKSYRIVLSLVLCCSTVTTYLVMRKISGKAADGLIWTGIFALAVVGLQEDKFYIFDAIDLTVFMIFAYATLYDPQNIKILLPLFFVELLNRESAGYIALWLMLYPLAEGYLLERGGGPARLRLLQAFFGAMLLAFGSWWTQFVRTRLFIRSFNPAIGVDAKHAAAGEHLDLIYNLQNFVHPYSKSGFGVALACTFGIGFMLTHLAKNFGRKSYAVFALITIMLAAVWVFGTVDETRVWLNFVPFAVIVAYASYSHKDIPSVLLKHINGTSDF